MYPVVLAIHNIIRWVVLIVGVIAVVRALIGFYRKGVWGRADRVLGMIYTSTMDIQLLLGLILYVFLSPITKSMFQNLSQAMSNPGMRFFGLEHAFYMIIAVILAHIGNSKTKRAAEPVARHRAALIWFGLALIFVLLGIPWTRPFFPGL